MDLVLDAFDYWMLDKFYASAFPTNFNSSSNLVSDYRPSIYSLTDDSFNSRLLRDNPIRQFSSLVVLTSILGIALYLLTAIVLYWLLFDKSILNHPKYKKNQVLLEIKQALFAIPFMSIFAALCFTLETRGYSKLFLDFDSQPIYNVPLSIVLFFLFTDFGVYLIHRGLHHPSIYKYLHKTHHKWVVSTPFASHAFHPMDGFLQSFPYHLFPFLFPIQKLVYLGLFVVVNIGTVMIHDGNFFINNDYIHGTACHAVHHMYFNYNYGQYTTIWDRLGGSYRRANDDMLKPEKNEITI